MKPTPEQSREILNEKIAQGRTSALALFQRVANQIPNDKLVKGGALHFSPTDPGARGIVLSYKGGEVFGIHHHALNQFSQRAGVPFQYLSGLVEAGGWRTQMAADIVTKHFNLGEPGTKFLTRAVDGEVRGFLSEKYRRLDSRPLLDAFAAECQKIGAVPIDGAVSDVRVALKAVMPELIEVIPGESPVALGLEWGNSDFGAARHALRVFLWRAWCDNGATLEDALAQVHLGGAISDDIELSKRTYDLDTRMSISMLRDVVKSVLAPKKIEAVIEGIRSANAKEIEWKNVSTKLAKKLLKGELDAAKAAFEGTDVINLPAGKSVWRASNAISWIAGNTESADRKLELQRIAGEVLNGKSDAAQEAA